MGCVFGGYTAVPWTSGGGYKTDNTAFMFSLINPSNKPSRMKVKANGQNAVIHNSSYGPIFGDGHDLIIWGDSNSNKKSYVTPRSYEIPTEIHDPANGKFLHGDTTRNFQTVEVEVFQVVE